MKRMKQLLMQVGMMLAVLTMVCGGVRWVEAAPILIDFESDTGGSKPNGFTSNDFSLVHFSDSNGTGLFVGDFGSQSHGQGLATFDDFDNSVLLMNFDVFMDSISLEFGNDDPSFSNPGDQALLTLFNGLVQVGQVAVVMNRDDIMNQTISYSGAAFDRATFFYNVNPSQGLIEIVDNITLTQAAPVPEPGTWMLMGTGLLGILGFGWRRKKHIA